MKFPTVTALSHMDLMGKSHTACIHCIACSVDEDHKHCWPGVGSFWLSWKANKVANGLCVGQAGCGSSCGCHVCL